MSFKKFSDTQKSEKPVTASESAKPTFASDKQPAAPATAPPPKSN